MLGKGTSVDLLHLDHNSFDCFGHQVHEWASPVQHAEKPQL